MTLRVLIAIPHYFHPQPGARLGSESAARECRTAALRACLAGNLVELTQ